MSWYMGTPRLPGHGGKGLEGDQQKRRIQAQGDPGVKEGQPKFTVALRYRKPKWVLGLHGGDATGYSQRAEAVWSIRVYFSTGLFNSFLLAKNMPM